MKRLLVKIAASLFVLGGAALVFWPINFWRLYDANWSPLALTYAEAYCTGYILGESGFTNKPSPDVAVCVENSDFDNETPSIGRAIHWGCEGLYVSVGFPIPDCKKVFEDYEMWWLLDGGYTWEWDKAHPRPVVAHADIGTAPPRQERDGNERNSGGRLGE